MNEEQIEKAEQLLGYYEYHSDLMTYGTQAERGTTAREWWMKDAVELMRDLLPEWSAFKEG